MFPSCTTCISLGEIREEAATCRLGSKSRATNNHVYEETDYNQSSLNEDRRRSAHLDLRTGHEQLNGGTSTDRVDQPSETFPPISGSSSSTVHILLPSALSDVTKPTTS